MIQRGITCSNCGHHMHLGGRGAFGLTRMQAAALDIIIQRAVAGDLSPSLDEISHALEHKSKAGAFRLVQALEERGFITRLPKRNRSIRLTDIALELYPQAKRETPHAA